MGLFYSSQCDIFKLHCAEAFTCRNNSELKDVIQLNDGRLVFGFKNSDIYIRNITKEKWEGNSRAQVSINHLLQLNDYTFLSDSGNFTSYVEYWDCNTLKSNRRKQPPSTNSQIYSIIQLDDGNIAIGLRNSNIEICSYEPYLLLNTLTGHSKVVFSLIQLTNGDLASSSLDKTIRLWSKKTYACKGVMFDRSVPYCIIELKPDQIASCSEDKTIKLWNVHTMQCNTVLSYEHQRIARIIQLEDGRLISGIGNKIVVWMKQTLKCYPKPDIHSDPITHFLQLRNGMLLSCDKLNYKLWEI